MSDEEALTRAHIAAIAFIEAHLFEPMTVKSIADHSGYSPSRFSRGFTRMQGESVMAYVRGRRLEEAVRRMLTDPGVRIVDLAFDCGFDSQEAFTRAFARAFGHPPGRLRSLGVVRSMVRKKKAPAREPQIVERTEDVPDLALAGLVERFSPANYVEMPAFWRRLDAFRGLRGQLDDAVYALPIKGHRDGTFDLMVGLRIDAGAPTPRPLEVLTLPASAYVVFRHRLQRGDIYPQINTARELIRTRYLPHSGHALADSLPFDRFPQGIRVTAGSFIDHYFPLRA